MVKLFQTHYNMYEIPSKMITALFFLLVLIAVSQLTCSSSSSSAAATNAAAEPSGCPVCSRVIRAVIGFSNANSITSSVALEKYCKLTSLEGKQ